MNVTLCWIELSLTKSPNGPSSPARRVVIEATYPL
jgi:hypothetical protein